jgi:hypothetical protein
VIPIKSTHFIVYAFPRACAFVWSTGEMLIL